MKQRREDGREAFTDGALAGRRPLLFGVGAVAEQKQDALVADAREPGQVGRLALHRGAVDLEVAGVHDDPCRCAHDQCAGAGYRMGRMHPLDLEMTEGARFAGADRVQLGGLDEPVLA